MCSSVAAELAVVGCVTHPSDNQVAVVSTVVANVAWLCATGIAVGSGSSNM